MAVSGRLRSRSRRASCSRDSRARLVPFSSAQVRRSVEGSPPALRSRASHCSMLSRMLKESGASAMPLRRTSLARASTPSSMSERANPRRALLRTGAASSLFSRMPRKISAESEGRLCARRRRPRATVDSGSGSREPSRIFSRSTSVSSGVPAVNCRSRSSRTVFGSSGRGVSGEGSASRAAIVSPCSHRMRASRRLASGDSPACADAILAASS